MSGNQFFTNLSLLMPHYIVVFGILFATLWNQFKPGSKYVTPIFSIVALALATFIFSSQFGVQHVELLGRLYTVDKLSVVFGTLSCMVGIIVILMTMGYERKFGNNKGEYYAILLTAVVSVMFLAGTTDLIMLFVSLETLTLCCVMLAGFSKRDLKSNEAALKYLLSTAATTATFMYGMSFLYGLVGSTNYYDINLRLYTIAQSPSLASILILLLIISVIGFKLSIVPFHMWTPDVYEGAPTPITAFLSIGSKLGGLVVAIRLLNYVFVDTQGVDHAPLFDWTPVMAMLAVASMVVGNLIALSQKSVKRMLAYSSIAHVGYFLIALCANTAESLAAVLFYVIIYGFMNLGAFACCIMIENEVGSDNMDDWSGLIRKRPWVVIAMTICLLNLGGLPVPPAGFLAKFFVFWYGMLMTSATNSAMGYLLVGAGLVTSVPALFYYSRVAIKMIVREPSAAVASLPERRIPLADSQAGPILAISIAIAGIIAGSTAVTPIMDYSLKAIGSLKFGPVAYKP